MDTSLIGAPDLEALLGQLLVNDSQQIRDAEAALKRPLAEPAFQCDLLHRLRDSANVQVRQLAAVLMRRRVGAHWSKFQPGVQNQFKACLLHQLELEHEKSVRRCTADVVCVIAKHALPKGEWQELYGYVVQCAQDARSQQREVAMQLLASLLECEEVFECLQPHLEYLRGLLQRALGDAEATVSLSALRATGAWTQAAFNEDDAKLLSPLVLPILDVGARAAAASDDAAASLACSVIDDLASTSAGCTRPHASAALDFALKCAACRGLEEGARGAALNLVCTLVKLHRKQVVKLGLVSPLLSGLYELCSEPEEEEVDEDEVSVHRRAAGSAGGAKARSRHGGHAQGARARLFRSGPCRGLEAGLVSLAVGAQVRGASARVGVGGRALQAPDASAPRAGAPRHPFRPPHPDPAPSPARHRPAPVMNYTAAFLWSDAMSSTQCTISEAAAPRSA